MMLTEKQLQERKLGIGGSDMAVILGLSKYKTPYQLWLDKTNDTVEEQQENQFMYWGNKLESVLREEFSLRNEVEVTTPDTLVHPDYPFLKANLDGYIPRLNAVLEIKTTSGFLASEWGESGSDEIPMQYLCQVVHYCAVTNAECAYIAVLIGGNDYREYKYIRNLDLENSLIEEAKKFWDYVETNTPPAPAELIDLKLMFPKHEPEKVKELAPELNEHLTAINDTRFKIKQLNQLEEQHKLHVMQFMEDAECLVNGEGKPIVTWKTNKRGSRTFLIK